MNRNNITFRVISVLILLTFSFQQTSYANIPSKTLYNKLAPSPVEHGPEAQDILAQLVIRTIQDYNKADTPDATILSVLRTRINNYAVVRNVRIAREGVFEIELTNNESFFVNRDGRILTEETGYRHAAHDIVQDEQIASAEHITRDDAIQGAVGALAGKFGSIDQRLQPIVMLLLQHSITPEGADREISFIRYVKGMMGFGGHAGKQGIYIDEGLRRGELVEGHDLGWWVEHEVLAYLFELDHASIVKIQNELSSGQISEDTRSKLQADNVSPIGRPHMAGLTQRAEDVTRDWAMARAETLPRPLVASVRRAGIDIGLDGDEQNEIIALLRELSQIEIRPGGAYAGYVEDVVAKFNRKFGEGLFRNKWLVLDAANGALTHIAQEIAERLGLNIVFINDSSDGRLINVQDNGSSGGSGALSTKRLSTVVKLLREQGLDVIGVMGGAGFDADADRVMLVDEEGNESDGDRNLGAIALNMYREGELAKDTVVVTTMATLGLIRAMEDNGIRAHLTNVGDRYIIEEMDREGYELGGEQSGHTINRKYQTTGDGIVTALAVFGYALRDGKKVSEVIGEIKADYPYLGPGENIVARTPEVGSAFMRELSEARRQDSQVFREITQVIRQGFIESGIADDLRVATSQDGYVKSSELYIQLLRQGKIAGWVSFRQSGTEREILRLYLTTDCDEAIARGVRDKLVRLVRAGLEVVQIEEETGATEKKATGYEAVRGKIVGTDGMRGAIYESREDAVKALQKQRKLKPGEENLNDGELVAQKGVLTYEMAYYFGQAHVRTFGINTPFFIGGDNRPSSRPLIEAFADGVVSMGGTVYITTEPITTPALGSESARRGYIGVVWSGSHLPWQRNGGKTFINGKKLTDKQTLALERNTYEIVARINPATDQELSRGQEELRHYEERIAGIRRQLLQLGVASRLAEEWITKVTSTAKISDLVEGKDYERVGINGIRFLRTIQADGPIIIGDVSIDPTRGGAIKDGTITIAYGAHLLGGARFEGPGVIAQGARVGGYVGGTLEKPFVVGPQAVIHGLAVDVARSIVGPESMIERAGKIRDAVIVPLVDNEGNVVNPATVETGSVISDSEGSEKERPSVVHGAGVGTGVRIRQYTSLGPYVTVDNKGETKALTAIGGGPEAQFQMGHESYIGSGVAIAIKADSPEEWKKAVLALLIGTVVEDEAIEKGPISSTGLLREVKIRMPDGEEVIVKAQRINIGAGTITSDYNAMSGDKSSVLIDGGAFTGANSVLHAPVWLGSRSGTGNLSEAELDEPVSEGTIVVGISSRPEKTIVESYRAIGKDFRLGSDLEKAVEIQMEWFKRLALLAEVYRDAASYAKDPYTLAAHSTSLEAVRGQFDELCSRYGKVLGRALDISIATLSAELESETKEDRKERLRRRIADQEAVRAKRDEILAQLEQYETTIHQQHQAVAELVSHRSIAEEIRERVLDPRLAWVNPIRFGQAVAKGFSDTSNEGHLASLRAAHERSRSKIIDADNRVIISEEDLARISDDELRRSIVERSKRSPDIMILPLSAVRAIARSGLSRGIVLLDKKHMDEGIKESASAGRIKVLELENYHFLHLAAAIDFARSLLSGNEDDIRIFYSLLMHHALPPDVSIDDLRAKPIISLLLPPVGEILIGDVVEERIREYAQFIGAA